MFKNLPTPQEIEAICAEAMTHCPQARPWQCETRGFDTYREVFEYWGSVSTLWACGYSRYLPKSIRAFFKPDVVELYEKIQALEEQNRRRGKALERCRAMRARGDATGGHVCLFSALLLEVEKICEEALK